MMKTSTRTNKKASDTTDKHVGKRTRMRRMMLGLSQTELGHALGVTFQQVQKYEKGTNRISASRLQQISGILQAPVSFFFEGAPTAGGHGNAKGQGELAAYVSDFLATAEGVALTKAFLKIKKPKLRRFIIELIEQLAERED